MIQFKPITVFELCYLAVSIAGFIGVIISLFIFKRQARESHFGVKENVLVALKSQQLEIDRLFITYPEMRKYFYDREVVPEGRTLEVTRATAMAEYLLDHLAAVILHTTTDDRPLVSTIWADYIRESFAQSPILCATLRKHQRWYQPALFKLMEEGCSAHQASASPQA